MTSRSNLRKDQRNSFEAPLELCTLGGIAEKASFVGRTFVETTKAKVMVSQGLRVEAFIPRYLVKSDSQTASDQEKTEQEEYGHLHSA